MSSLTQMVGSFEIGAITMAQTSDKVSSLKGIGSQTASLLEAAGIGSVEILAGQKPGALIHKLVEVNHRRKIMDRLPSFAQLEEWITQAQQFPETTGQLAEAESEEENASSKGLFDEDDVFGLTDGLPGDPGKTNIP